MLIFQTILKLFGNNFLDISFQTGSVVYLHSGVSGWHQAQITISPWAPKAFGELPLGGTLYIEVFYISTTVGRTNTKLGTIIANALLIGDERC